MLKYVQWDLVLESLRSILALVRRVVEVLIGAVEAVQTRRRERAASSEFKRRNSVLGF